MMKNKRQANFVMDKYVYDAYKIGARMLGMSFSFMIRTAAEDYLRRHLNTTQKQAIFEKTGHFLK